jgi:hypothetical protein
MSDELFEVAFSGQIKEGADLSQVKAKVAAMFKADATKLAHLFSGKRMVIKKNIDQAMANKYKAALDNAGAVCEIKSLNEVPAEVVSSQAAEPPTAKAAVPVVSETAATPSVSAPSASVPSQTQPQTSGDVPAAPVTDPLGIGANDITEWSAGIAPVGSDMQDEVQATAEPDLDISGLDMAPAGSDLGQAKKEADPPPPDTDGLSLVD